MNIRMYKTEGDILFYLENIVIEGIQWNKERSITYSFYLEDILFIREDNVRENHVYSENCDIDGFLLFFEGRCFNVLRCEIPNEDIKKNNIRHNILDVLVMKVNNYVREVVGIFDINCHRIDQRNEIEDYTGDKEMGNFTIN